MANAQKLKRDDYAPDCAWSDPGSTRGIADRWTTRYLCGLWLTAGHNGRKGPDYTTFVVSERAQPWKVYALGAHPGVPHQWQLVLVASGVAGSVEQAKAAAEQAATAWKA